MPSERFAIRRFSKEIKNAAGPDSIFHKTVLANVKTGTDFACEETFGPVVSVSEVERKEEVLELANAMMYGLSVSRGRIKFFKIAD